jgi:hypothetical protein
MMHQGQEAWREELVTIEGDPVLRGTLSVPASVPTPVPGTEPAPKRVPGVLFLAGSGVIDRDENAPGLRMGIFKELSEAISRFGPATLRYDKRGVGKSQGDFLSAGLWDLVDDAERALDHLRGHPAVDPDRIVVLGHSEGATLAAMLNARRPVQGLILIAGAARSLREIILWQGEALFGELGQLGGPRGFIVRLLRVPQRGRREMTRTHEAIVRSEKPVMRIRGQPLNAKWLREHFAYDVREALAKVTCPVLVVAGSRDIQVPPEEAERIAALVEGPVKCRVIEDMNHILRLDRTRPTMLGLQGHYKAMIALPLHPELLKTLSHWLINWLSPYP